MMGGYDGRDHVNYRPLSSVEVLRRAGLLTACTLLLLPTPLLEPRRVQPQPHPTGTQQYMSPDTPQRFGV
jgi:hypothetical protein